MTIQFGQTNPLDQKSVEQVIYDGGWRTLLDRRSMSEVEFAITYTDDFNHGTTSHYQLRLTARLARLLDLYESAMQHCLRANIETAVSQPGETNGRTS